MSSPTHGGYPDRDHEGRDHTDHLYDHHLAEPPTRRIHQYGAMIGLAVLAVVFTVWLVWSYEVKQSEAEHNAAAVGTLCRQLVGVGQPCAAQAAGSDEEGVSGDAAAPAPTASLTGSALAPTRRVPGAPAPTDEQGVPQAFQPGEDALIVSVHVQEGRLVLTYDDGARLDAGPVNEETLAIVLRASPSVSPSPSPSVTVSPSPSPINPLYPPGADAPDPTDTIGPVTPEETPS